MINYRLNFKDEKNRAVQIFMGTVADTGKISVVVPEEDFNGSIDIEWEVSNGDHGNNQFRFN